MDELQETGTQVVTTPAPSAGQFYLVWRRLRRSKAAMGGGLLVLLLLVVALLAPWIAPYYYADQNLDIVLQPPSPAHPLGTDDFGRDVLSRIIYGSRISLLVGTVAVGIGASLGIFLGAAAGYFGGWVDHLVIALIDIAWSFPTILLAIALVAVLQPGLTSAMVALGLVTWPSYARLMRGQVLALREKEFVEAARAVGAPAWRILGRQIIPNALPPIIVMATLGMADAIIVESTLSYLSLGAQPPQPSWGSMLNAGRTFMYHGPWLTIFPGLAILFTVLGFNLFGDALRDAMDPHLKR
ncbi:MAG TPA: ABC transporter permease [Firmicutes bacterium]|nr:ABC transporter permease [Bacillota bacterium]